MDKISIQAVFFDLDDTLYHRGGALRRWAEQFAKERLTLPGTPLDQAVVESIIAADANGYCARPDFCRALKECFPVIHEPVEEFLEAFQLGLVAHIQPEDGVADLLDQLAAVSIPFGIVTNGSTHQQLRKIKHLALDQVARFTLVSEAFGKKKPHPDIFLAAARRLEIAPDHILFVGDHPDLDMIGAHQVGMRTAWMRRGREWAERDREYRPDFIIDNLGELVPLFRNS